MTGSSRIAVLLGGVKRIGAVAEKLVPFMFNPTAASAASTARAR